MLHYCRFQSDFCLFSISTIRVFKIHDNHIMTYWKYIHISVSYLLFQINSEYEKYLSAYLLGVARQNRRKTSSFTRGLFFIQGGREQVRGQQIAYLDLLIDCRVTSRRLLTISDSDLIIVAWKFSFKLKIWNVWSFSNQGIDFSVCVFLV